MSLAFPISEKSGELTFAHFAGGGVVCEAARAGSPVGAVTLAISGPKALNSVLRDEM